MNEVRLLREHEYDPADLAAVEAFLPSHDPELVRGERGILPISETSLDGNEGRYLQQCIEANWISSTGKFVKQFETAFARRVGCAHGVACSSGTTAVHLAMATLGIGPGDEVIVPAFTMIATANAVTYTGGCPVFVDAEPRTGNLDPSQLERAITPRTKAILVVHIYGHPVDMDAVGAVASRHNLALIEDAAEAHGALYKGRPAGSLGAAATFSFYGNKIISTGEGGMITTNDAAYAKLARQLRDHAFSPERHFWHRYTGFNYRMTNMQGAVGQAQTERFDELVEGRRRTGWRYRERLRNMPGLRWPEVLTDVEPVFWMNCLLVDAERFGCGRDALRARLASHGIETRTCFIPMHFQPVYRRHWRSASFPVAEDWCRRGLLLPSGPRLTAEDIEYICRQIEATPRR